MIFTPRSRQYADRLEERYRAILFAEQAVQTEEIEPAGEPARMTRRQGALAVAVCLGFFGLLVIPLLFMLAMPAWALLTTLPDWLAAEQKNWPLIIIGIFTLILEAWMIVEGMILLPGVRGVLERTAAENRINSEAT